MTVSKLLIELNEIQKELGLKPFKSWKQSKEKLACKIETMKQKLTNQRMLQRHEDAKPKRSTAEQKEVTSLLEQYNSYAKITAGFAPLSEWYGSIDELSARIREVSKRHREQMTPTHSERKLKRAGKTPKAAPKSAASKEQRSSLLSPICDELGISPKVARTKLRKKHGAQWKEMSAAELRKFLTK